MMLFYSRIVLLSACCTLYIDSWPHPAKKEAGKRTLTSVGQFPAYSHRQYRWSCLPWFCLCPHSTPLLLSHLGSLDSGGLRGSQDKDSEGCGSLWRLRALWGCDILIIDLLPGKKMHTYWIFCLKFYVANGLPKPLCSFLIRNSCPSGR